MKASEAMGMGKARFVWRYGVLYWGIPVGITSELLMRVRLQGGLHLVTGDHLWASMAARGCVFGLVGLLFGHFLWKGTVKGHYGEGKGSRVK